MPVMEKLPGPMLDLIRKIGKLKGVIIIQIIQIWSMLAALLGQIYAGM